MDKSGHKQARSQAATAAYANDGRENWQGRDRIDAGWHDTFNRLLDRGHIFMGQTYTEAGMLFRGMPSGMADAMRSRNFWHSQADNPLCQLERELEVIFCSEVARDALAVARPWQDQSNDAVILIFYSQTFVERWRARSAAMLGFADVGMVFKYPCLAEPLTWSELYAVVMRPEMLSECKNRIAALPAAQRPHLAAPAPADVHSREAWQTVIDELLAHDQLTVAVSQPATEYPCRIP